jgi:hypothetical protein
MGYWKLAGELVCDYRQAETRHKEEAAQVVLDQCHWIKRELSEITDRLSVITDNIPAAAERSGCFRKVRHFSEKAVGVLGKLHTFRKK